MCKFVFLSGKLVSLDHNFFFVKIRFFFFRRKNARRLFLSHLDANCKTVAKISVEEVKTRETSADKSKLESRYHVNYVSQLMDDSTPIYHGAKKCSGRHHHASCESAFLAQKKNSKVQTRHFR